MLPHSNFTTPLHCIAELSLSYSYSLPAKDRVFVKNAIDAVEVIRPYFEDYIELKEHAYALLLNQASQVIGIYKLSEGGLAATLIDIRLLFCVALQCLAVNIILFHNHPSGNLHPSAADISLTSQARDGAKLISLTLLDHIILTRDGHYSMADNGDL